MSLRLSLKLLWMFVGVLVIGGIFLYLGSEWFILGAIDLADSFGISERIIGITVVSVGTSIPELATSMIAIYNKEKGISLGNLIELEKSKNINIRCITCIFCIWCIWL